MELITDIRINATPEKVWQVLSDFKSYPAWNPFIKEITGEVKAGNNIRVVLSPPDGMGITMKPRVLVFDHGKAFRWLGHLFIPGLFDGEHSFELRGHSDGTTTFVHSEHFSGLLVPLFRSMLEGSTKRGFILMNEALKKRAEELK